ncbi:protein crumbs homolog 3 [Hyla sarda]|uniref:protein crumbs homolog 3 n=1 Tax=Hyla sarda TaxID=327740 RepID=UPI0024C35695|nr:protein crumbs homolog 3 [Hyla sarda]
MTCMGGFGCSRKCCLRCVGGAACVGGAGEFRAGVAPLGAYRPSGILALMDPSTLLLPLFVALSGLCLALAQNETATTPAPSRLTESERLAAIIVPSVVGGILLICIGVFFLIKVKEKRQTEGTYRPSSEEQVGSRVETNAALKLPPEERLI